MYLFMDLGELLKVIFQKGDLLLLCSAPPSVVRVHFCALHRENTPCSDIGELERTIKKENLEPHYLFHSSCQILNKQLPEVMQGLELLSL